jgi:hypothetical protein
MPPPPSEETVLGWFDELSNWGRWGPDDRLGTLNHLTPAKRVSAARLVRDGLSVSCSWDIRTGRQPGGDGRWPSTGPPGSCPACWAPGAPSTCCGPHAG